MSEQDILKQLTSIFRDIFDDDSITLGMDTVAEDVPGWNSLMHINIIVSAEAQFGVRFKTAETEELKNVGDFVRLIEKKCIAGSRTVNAV